LATEMLRAGDQGPRVATLQLSLNARQPTMLPSLAVDAVFGPKTHARVQEFQRQNQLTSDGIAGQLTLAKLAGPGQHSRDDQCGNGDPGNAGSKLQIQKMLETVAAGRTFGVERSRTTAPTTGANAAAVLLTALLNNFKALGQDQITFAKGVYADSIDYSLVLLSNIKGAQNRSFTFTITPGLGHLFTFFGPLSFMNVGTFQPSNEKLIHELAHVWQSQHHPDPGRYMTNSLVCQALARSANEKLVPPGSAPPEDWVQKKFPNSFPNSAYAYKLRLPFADYNSEQIAQQAQNGEAPIVAHLKSISRGAVDPDNVASLTRVQFENRLNKDVKYGRLDPVR
jgi:hypothetical protein